MKGNKNPFWAVVSKALAVMTATLIVALILAPGAWAASNYKILYNFTGGTDGSQPRAGILILDASGNLYGTTNAGGASGNGTVFKLAKNSDGSWTETVLYSFAGGTDGAAPYTGVTFDTSGNLYGTTVFGGDYSAGIVYQLVPNSDGTWAESVLYSFTGGTDGASPWAGVIFDATGALYGTTEGGGASGVGVVYKLTPTSGGAWTETVLHSFTGGKDGINPLWGKLTFDAVGNLYGVAGAGGTGNCGNWAGPDCGVVFELTPQSDGTWKEQVIFTFHGRYSGFLPTGPVTFDSAGRLYGAAQGWNGNYGNVFKLTLGAKGKWTERVLHVFAGNQDGAYPHAGPVFDVAGHLYSTTFFGEDLNGDCCYGQVFKLVPHTYGWTKYALHRFRGPPQDGSNTSAGVVLDAAGNVYGTTDNGGTSGNGVVFEIMK